MSEAPASETPPITGEAFIPAPSVCVRSSPCHPKEKNERSGGKKKDISNGTVTPAPMICGRLSGIKDLD